MKHELSILIPTFNGDCFDQVKTLSRQADNVADFVYEIIVADDGSTDKAILDRCRRVESISNCRFIACPVNKGRAAIRNFLAKEARYDWLLFMDCDMSIPNDRFLLNYLECQAEAVAYGGYIVGEGDSSCLRYLYEKSCEPEHRAECRKRRPYQHFHTCNFLIRREVMLAHPFDERLRHYGYEDVLFGKQLRMAHIPIDHLDNPAGFYTFEDNANFVAKTEEGLRTLHEFRSDLRGYSQLLTFVDGIHIAPVRWVIRLWHWLFGRIERRCLCGPHPTLRLLKIYKLGYYLSLT